MAETNQPVTLLIPEPEGEGFEAGEQRDGRHALEQRLCLVAPLQIIIGNLRAQMMNVTKPEVARIFYLPRDRLAAAAGFASAIAGESHHTRNERDPRSVAELTFSEASSGGAEFCAPASLKTSFTGQSLDCLANSAAREKGPEPIARLISPIYSPPIVPKRPPPAKCPDNLETPTCSSGSIDREARVESGCATAN